MNSFKTNKLPKSPPNKGEIKVTFVIILQDHLWNSLPDSRQSQFHNLLMIPLRKGHLPIGSQKVLIIDEMFDECQLQLHLQKDQ